MEIVNKVILETRFLPPITLIDKSKIEDRPDTRPAFSWQNFLGPYITVEQSDGTKIFSWGFKRKNIFKELVILGSVSALVIAVLIFYKRGK